MKRLVCVLAALTLVFTAGIVSAQGQPTFDLKAKAIEKAASLQAQARVDAQKQMTVRQILQAREDLQQRGMLDAAFKTYWTERLINLTVDQLESVARQGTSIGFEESIASATGSTLVAADAGILSLGDSSADLLYTKVTPCRVADTRVAGGILGTGATRGFYVAGSTSSWFAGQGGTACGIPLGPATAVAVNITVVAASGWGWLRAYPYGGSSSASIINYNAGDTIANGLVMPICDPAAATCTRDLTIAADSYGGHLIIDVMGYWAKPAALAKYRTIITEAYTGATTSLPSYPSCANYETVSLTAPVSGRIVVTAHTQVRSLHNYGTQDYYTFGVSTSSTSCSFTLGEGIYVSTAQNSPTGYYYPTDTVFNVYDVVAGSHTYYLNGYKDSSSGAASFWYAGMMASFTPY